ncbi:MAG: ArsR family transcriptional regulator [Flavobacteriales bacterium]
MDIPFQDCFFNRNIAMNKLYPMGLTKTEIFTDQQNAVANMAKVLGHPARIAILQYLFRSETCVCGDLVSEIGLAQPTVSQHLRELKNMNLIQGSIEGTKVCYCINSKAWEGARELLFLFLSQQPKTSGDCC